MNSKSALAVARMELLLFLCVWQPVVVVIALALVVGMLAIDVTVAIFLPSPARPVMTP